MKRKMIIKKDIVKNFLLVLNFWNEVWDADMGC